jgi:TonB family protein
MVAPGPDSSSSTGADSSHAASASASLPVPLGVSQPGQNGVGYPSCRDCPAPVYTAPVRAARFEGTVKLQAVILPDGTASNIEIVQGASSDVNANAVDTVKHWRFNPAVGPNGKPVAVIVPLEVSYQQYQPEPSAASAPPLPPRSQAQSQAQAQSQSQSPAQSTLPCSNGRPILKRGAQPDLPPCPDPPPDDSPSAGYPPPRAPNPSESLIERARDAAFEFSEKLPNYICEEFMSRYMQRGRDETSLDVVSSEIIYESGHESYRNVKINDHPTDKALEEVGGSWSTGEFASTLLALFNPDTDARFQSGGASTISGFSAEVYDFEVRREKSHWELHVDSQSLSPAYGGSVWIDPKTARVLRIEMQARNMPTDFPMDQVESAVDYSYVNIGGSSFLLPVHAESLGCERGTNQCSHNVIDFRNYHEFKVDIKLGN